VNALLFLLKPVDGVYDAGRVAGKAVSVCVCARGRDRKRVEEEEKMSGSATAKERERLRRAKAEERKAIKKRAGNESWRF